jgi:hypothetical protein
MKLNTIVMLFLSLIIFYIIYSNYDTLVEDFSLQSFIPSSSSSSSSSSATDSSNNIYQYLAPLSPDNTWSQDTQNAWVKKFNDTLTSIDPSAALITTPTLNDINYMTEASEAEAQSYIQNGVWPLDTYVTNLYNNMITQSNNLNSPTDQLKTEEKNMWNEFQKIYPNRLIYRMFLGPSTLPQTAILNTLNPFFVGSGVLNNENAPLTCKSAQKGTISQPDGTNIVIPDNGYYPYYKNGYTLDNTIFETIPGLTFDSSACNICGIYNFNYLSTKNTCKFSLNNPVGYDIFAGLNNATPSSV